MKKTLSFLLVITMLCSIGIVSVSAEDRKFPQMVHNRLALLNTKSKPECFYPLKNKVVLFEFQRNRRADT